MRMSNRALIFSVIGVIVVLGCGMVSGSAPPDNTVAEPTALLPSEPPTAVVAATHPPALPERRRLTVEFPPKMRAGDSDVVRLTLEVDDLGNLTPTAQIGGNEVTGEVIELPNLYESHHV